MTAKIYLFRLWKARVRPICALLGVAILLAIGIDATSLSIAGHRVGDLLGGLSIVGAVVALLTLVVRETIRGVLACAPHACERARRLWAIPEFRDAAIGIGGGLAVTAILPFLLAAAPFALCGYGCHCVYRWLAADEYRWAVAVSVARLGLEVPAFLAMVSLVLVMGALATLAMPFLALAGVEPGDLFARITALFDLLEKKENK